MVGGGSAQKVSSGGSGPGDPVTRSAAVDARCDAPAAEVDPVTPASVCVAGDNEVDASVGVGECSSSPVPVESTKTEQVSTPATSSGCAAVAESVPPLAPESEVIDMTIDSGDEGSTWAIVGRKRKLNFSVPVAPPLLESPASSPLGRLQIVETSPVGKLISKKMCLSDIGSDSD